MKSMDWLLAWVLWTLILFLPMVIIVANTMNAGLYVIATITFSLYAGVCVYLYYKALSTI